MQPTAQVFFLAQQALEQPALQELLAQQAFAQQAFAQPAAQPAAEEPQELRANAETATTDIRDRLWITFFISSIINNLGSVIRLL